MKIQQQIFMTDSSERSGLFLNGRIRVNAIGQFSGMTYRQAIPEIVTQEHQWVSVLDPRNNRSLLHACDDCGIVKSENSIARNCRATPGIGMVSSGVSNQPVLM